MNHRRVHGSGEKIKGKNTKLVHFNFISGAINAKFYSVFIKNESVGSQKVSLKIRKHLNDGQKQQ